ncbi:MAG: helix-turn-helix domain-containing protein [Deltaproteobacteria bacterium]|nr:helix-turn-helix domain-containing protein [Deltaproteobacteria bacterium]
MNLLTVKDVAIRLKVGKTTVYEWAALGLIPCVRLNGVLRFDESELQTWVNGFRHPARPAASGLVGRLAAKAVEAAASGLVSDAVKGLTGKH